ncbi:Sugar transporter conserved site [Macrophomina phaseolina MS6]|uniref:Sugar transporter conserved site n=1 Tax=Macrophomina phaseolina (strain MS6) TaxID=1126212 RepID=K2QHI9_MACPH|nr:Sugar transporter conserved site [Macrophomina phaseolina MS6]
MAHTTNDPAFEVHWVTDGTDNPKNRSFRYKAFVVTVMGYGATVVSLFSTSYTPSIPGLEKTFGISKTTGLLGVTTYLLGMACGSIVLAPLSEMYGRRTIHLVTLLLFSLLSLPSALATNIESVIVSRFFAAFFGSAMMTNAPGSVNDVVSQRHRTLAFCLWCLGPTNGPVLGSILGGFCFEYLGWRWNNWLIAIMGGVAFCLVACLQETYAPVLLRKKAAEMRAQTGDERWWSRYENKAEFSQLLKVNLSRPFIMMFTEPICAFWDFYIGVVYAILYLCFVAYPISFREDRAWSDGISGLAFCGIGCGITTMILFEPIIRRAASSYPKDPTTGETPPEAIMGIICASGISLAVGQLWFAWTCSPNVHWVAPILAGIPFGAGYGGIFVYGSNYLVDSYGIYAASALAGNTVTRSVLGAFLPLAGPSMYRSLGPNWAGTVLGIIATGCIPIPFVFYFRGGNFRRLSKMVEQINDYNIEDREGRR